MHTAKRDEELCQQQTPVKLSKKEKKKQKEAKKLAKHKKMDADKVCYLQIFTTQHFDYGMISKQISKNWPIFFSVTKARGVSFLFDYILFMDPAEKFEDPQQFNRFY